MQLAYMSIFIIISINADGKKVGPKKVYFGTEEYSLCFLVIAG
jgi:hypothetical protein